MGPLNDLAVSSCILSFCEKNCLGWFLTATSSWKVRCHAFTALLVRERQDIRLEESRLQKGRISKKRNASFDSFRSSDLRVMSPARFRCATKLI